jgi:hypothetical protein
MGTRLDTVEKSTSALAAIDEIMLRVLIVRCLATDAAAKLIGAQSESMIPVPSIAAPLPVLVRQEVFHIRRAAAAVGAAWGYHILHT